MCYTYHLSLQLAKVGAGCNTDFDPVLMPSSIVEALDYILNCMSGFVKYRQSDVSGPFYIK